MSTVRSVLIFAGFATGFSLFLSAVSGAVKAEVRRARDALFEVGPNCEWLRFRGFGDEVSDDDVTRHIAQARTYYFDPLIRDLKAQGYNPEEVRGAVFEDLFPECEWPPRDMLSTRGVVWAVLGRWVELEAMRGDPCDPLVEPPPGMVCTPRGGGYVLERSDL